MPKFIHQQQRHLPARRKNCEGHLLIKAIAINMLKVHHGLSAARK